MKNYFFNKRPFKIAVSLMVFCLFIFGCITYLPKVISVSSAGNKEIPIYSVETDKKQIALSFDAAWGNEDIDIILEILERQEVTATFFVTGAWAEDFPDDLKKIAERGHDLGNHGDRHESMSQMAEAERKKEIAEAHNKVKEVTGIEMELFRPPYGDYNKEVINTALECSYYPIQWDVDSLDWKDYGPESIVQTVTEHKNLDSGSIILMHNGAKYTKYALEPLIIELKEMDYQFVPISKLIYKENYRMDTSGRQMKNN